MDGRRQVVRDAATLAAQINTQALTLRVDRDHRSEPASKTFSGETAADGWLSNLRLNARGGIDAGFDIGEEAGAALRAKKYRYLSPPLLLDGAGAVRGPGFPAHARIEPHAGLEDRGRLGLPRPRADRASTPTDGSSRFPASPPTRG